MEMLAHVHVLVNVQFRSTAVIAVDLVGLIRVGS